MARHHFSEDWFSEDWLHLIEGYEQSAEFYHSAPQVVSEFEAVLFAYAYKTRPIGLIIDLCGEGGGHWEFMRIAYSFRKWLVRSDLPEKVEIWTSPTQSEVDLEVSWTVSRDRAERRALFDAKTRGVRNAEILWGTVSRDDVLIALPFDQDREIVVRPGSVVGVKRLTIDVVEE